MWTALLWIGLTLRTMPRRLYLITAGSTCITILIVLLILSPSIPADSLERRRLLFQLPAMSAYEAPLRLADEATRIADEYFAFLHCGHSIDQHKQVIGNVTDLDSTITHIFPECSVHGLYYAAHLDDAGLASVRAGVGVDMVECETQGFFIGDVRRLCPTSTTS